jgi:NAD-dependent SIR2 family protein deacetylase
MVAPVATTLLPAQDFVRRFAMRSEQIAWFLGAGASASAGIPTAWHMINGFKADLFAASHKLPLHEIDVDDPVWIARINQYFDGANGFPPKNDPSEYQIAFERMYPAARDRRAYMAEQINKGTPSFGHRVMAALIASRKLPLVFTTNFDDLVEQSARAMDELLESSLRTRLRVSALNNTDVADRCVREGDWPLLVKLHGDYQSVSLKNTEQELQTQDQVLRRVLNEASRRFGLIVVGYSGRDASIMNALMEALESQDPYPNGLFWICRPNSQQLPQVNEFLDRAQAKSVEVCLVECDTFDELFAEIYRQMSHRFVPPLTEAVSRVRPAAAVVDVTLSTASVTRFPALRCNALMIESWPKMARAFPAPSMSTADDLRTKLRNVKADADAVPLGNEILAFGSDNDLQKTLDVTASAWKPEEKSIDLAEDTVAFGLIYRSLTRALTRSRPLSLDFRDSGHSLYLRDPAKIQDATRRRRIDNQLVSMRRAYKNDLYGIVPGLGRSYAEGVHLKVELRLGRWWLLFEPFTWVRRPSERIHPDPVGPWLRERWTLRRNQEWAAIIDAWAELLAPNDHTEVRSWWLADERSGIDASFTLGRTTAWAQPGQGGLR